ncbi:hypothetical protein DFH06DRAFT_972553 [Mycena polygramma]|nr:hypothetical protein DFH06DRAFT_972553 [Mycena polygramma]
MESPFLNRLNTNYVPSDEEIESIRTDLALRGQELARINERIRELSAQRDQLQTYMESHKALISHPRRLPSDIVREIFTACLPWPAVMDAQEAPLLLCQICSAWRIIALSTPSPLVRISRHRPSSNYGYSVLQPVQFRSRWKRFERDHPSTRRSSSPWATFQSGGVMLNLRASLPDVQQQEHSRR